MTDYTAQRRYPRLDSENSLLVRCLGASSQEGFVKTRVVGQGGCMFVSDESLGVGTSLEIAFTIRGRVGRSKGRIVYEIPQRFGHVEVGVEFECLSPGNRAVIDDLFRQEATV